MGFGWLFIGYFISFLMSYHKFGFATEIIGFYFMFLALGKLREYKNSLQKCLFPLLAMTVCSAADAVFTLREMVTSSAAPAALSTALSVVSSLSFLLFHIFLLAGISSLGQDTDLPKICRQAKTSLFFVLVYVFMQLAACVLSLLAGFWTDLSLVGVPVTILSVLLYFLVPVFMLFLIYRCYADICAPGDEEMPTAPSRFAFVNEWRKRSEEKNREIEAKLSEMKNNTKK